MTSKYGYRLHPVTKQKHSFHNGIDIAAPVGSPVIAPASGNIIQLWDHSRGGKCMAMMTADGLRLGFAHLNKCLVKEGEFVIAGQLIAESGNTGASTGPHLHFTVKKGADWINPELLISFG